MSQPWRPLPQFKLECSGKTYINTKGFDIQLVLPENNISYIVLNVADYQNKLYVDVFDAFDTLDLSLSDDGGSNWTKRFSGPICTTAPGISPKGEILQVAAWGQGIALDATHCNTSYGLESADNHALQSPKNVLDDLITNHINKSFDGSNTNWSITNKIEDIHNTMDVTYLNSNYDSNFVVINRLADLVTAWGQDTSVPRSEPGFHWLVDPSGNLYAKEIDADHSDGNWDHYWGGTQGIDPGTQASSTIVVKADMLVYDFKKNVDEYANNVVLASQFRKPSEDLWCENGGAGRGSALWDKTDLNLTDDAVTYKVGSHSILFDLSIANGLEEAWIPVAKNAAWDLSVIGSRYTRSALNFWAYVPNGSTAGAGTTAVNLFTNAANYFTCLANMNSYITDVDRWTYISLQVGPDQGELMGSRTDGFSIGAGAPDWTDINWIQFSFPFDVGIDLYIDDLHFSGMIVREAKDTSEITANNEYQKIILNNAAVNDTLTSGTVGTTDQGTAAQLAYAELLRRSRTARVGVIRIPLALSILPGQTVHIHACEKSDGSYRIDTDMRVKEIRHIIGSSASYGGFETQLNLTDDVTNSHAFGAPSLYKLLKQYAGALGHSEARDLKGGALDNLIPRLTETY